MWQREGWQGPWPSYPRILLKAKMDYGTWCHIDATFMHGSFKVPVHKSIIYNQLSDPQQANDARLGQALPVCLIYIDGLT